ncbi:4Fe-4S dicluster domain-containing protein [Geobacter luticola]|uniref:4Fe-4S dicluster domain-containing protein n=1 Tax=Geomobilimonas luticola TaxID=1114878 RepID=A0ABS5SCK0_9BACT|nr:4Fe-4S dicluster domain-containing protein [Geomobilimonas luticola]MBT0652336.1 4Fe-4S dicluster domain-containing protein [Geomobilimonas luticola]
MSAATPQVDCQRCSACGRCVAACPAKLFTLDVDGFRKTARRQVSTDCRRCFACGRSCPVRAISPAPDADQKNR